MVPIVQLYQKVSNEHIVMIINFQPAILSPNFYCYLENFILLSNYFLIKDCQLHITQLSVISTGTMR